jgi:hypothetical protein
MRKIFTPDWDYRVKVPDDVERAVKADRAAVRWRADLALRQTWRQAADVSRLGGSARSPDTA